MLREAASYGDFGGSKKGEFFEKCFGEEKYGNTPFRLVWLPAEFVGKELFDMVKGAQKQMIVLKTADSRYFDEAYFVLRRDLPRPGARRDILDEANRILRECEPEASARPRRGFRALLLFLGGILCGGGVAVVLCLLLL